MINVTAPAQINIKAGSRAMLVNLDQEIPGKNGVKPQPYCFTRKRKLFGLKILFHKKKNFPPLSI